MTDTYVIYMVVLYFAALIKAIKLNTVLRISIELIWISMYSPQAVQTCQYGNIISIDYYLT